jgi:RNA polymerase sigma-B factor
MLGGGDTMPTNDAVRVRSGSHPGRTSAEAQTDQRATRLVDEMAALPDGHPQRAALRARAIEAWMPMAGRLARRYARRGEDMEDLQQAAAVGLIKAVDGFDPDHGSDFVSYAIPTVLGELKRHFRDRAWSLRIPRRLQELRLAIGAAQSELAHTLGRAATAADVAEHLDVSEEAVLEALEAGRAYRATSLSTPADDEAGRELSETLGCVDHGYELTELRMALPPAMAVLTERERQIVALRFYGNLTQTVIGERLGISQMHVSRLLARALGKLRTQFT